MSLSSPSRRPRHRLSIMLAALLLAGITALLFVNQPQTPESPATPSANSQGKPSPTTPLGTFHVPPLPVQSELKLRPEVAEALGFGPVAPWTRRLDLIRNFPHDLTPVEVNALLTSMVEVCPQDVSYSVHSSYMHELACFLQQRDEIRPLLAQGLATLAADVHRNTVTRDYAIQHLRQVWRRAGNDTTLRSALEETLRQFTSMDSVIATPSLLALHLLGTELSADPGNIGNADSRPLLVASPDNAQSSFYLPDSDLLTLIKPIFTTDVSTESMPSHLTALRIVADRRFSDFRDHLLATLKNPNEHALVRMAAANALGKIADPRDLASLASYAPGDTRVATALRHALKSKSPN